MFIELIELLRCPRDHDETWLVGAFSAMRDRHVLEGTLGCPVCHAEYAISNGVTYLVPEGEAESSGRGVVSGDTGSGGARADPQQHDPLRIAALLGLEDSGGVVVLHGAWAAAADSLGELTGVSVIQLDADHAEYSHFASPLVSAGTLPLGAASTRGIALDPRAGSRLVHSAVRALRPRGRLVGPASLPLPQGVRELARDEQLWVAERLAEPPRLVSLESSRL